jgi:hypothetical protein
MAQIQVDPCIAPFQTPVTVTIQGDLEGNHSGVAADLARFGLLDFEGANPELIKQVGTDQFGRKTFRMVSEALGSNQFELGVKYGSGEYGRTEMLVNNGFGALVKALDDLFCAFRDIPRYEEPGMLSENRRSAKFGWGNWHADPDPVLIKDGEAWMDREDADAPQNNYLIDYSRGVVHFKNPIDEGSEVRANYSFRMIDQKAYISFLKIALSLINARKPSTNFDESNFPENWFGLLVLSAYEQAAKCLIPKMATFRFRRLFEDPDRMMSELRTNAADSRAQFEIFLPQMKRRGLIFPLGVADFNRRAPWKVDETNYQRFAIGR